MSDPEVIQSDPEVIQSDPMLDKLIEAPKKNPQLSRSDFHGITFPINLNEKPIRPPSCNGVVE